MAGFRCCYRNLLVFNTSRLTDRNGVLLQLTRKRHHLVFQMSALQSRVAFQKPKLVYNANKLLIYRLASTNIAELKESDSIPSLKISEVKNDSNQLNKEVTQLNSESENLSKGHDMVESSSSIVIDESSLPPIPSEIQEVQEVPVIDFISMGLKEPTFQSLGLGSWWPSGIVQQILEYLHINLDLPWWGSIFLLTAIIRALMMPLNIKNRRDSLNLTNNHMPHIMAISEKMKQAKLRGDYPEMALCNQQLQKYITENNVSLFGFAKVALIQAPVFLSMYYALSGMASAPVESLKTGGLFWFQDLTQPDPYYILPFVLSGTLLGVIETGAEGNPSAISSPTLRWIFRGIPVVVLLVSFKFAACLTWYWSVSNLITLGYVGALKIPALKKFFQMPEMNPKSFEVVQKHKKGFVEGFKEGIENAKITRQLAARDRMNQTAFERAGSGPIPRTFKKNPLLQNAKKSS